MVSKQLNTGNAAPVIGTFQNLTDNYLGYFQEYMTWYKRGLDKIAHSWVKYVVVIQLKTQLTQIQKMLNFSNLIGSEDDYTQLDLKHNKS